MVGSLNHTEFQRPFTGTRTFLTNVAVSQETTGALARYTLVSLADAASEELSARVSMANLARSGAVADELETGEGTVNEPAEGTVAARVASSYHTYSRVQHRPLLSMMV